MAEAPALEASAILWRRDALTRALSALGDGDVDPGRLVSEAAAAPQARVCHVADTLNFRAASASG